MAEAYVLHHSRQNAPIETQCCLHTRDEFHPAERSDTAVGLTQALGIRSKGHKR